MCVELICNGQDKNTNWVGLKTRWERKIIMLTSILNNFKLLIQHNDHNQSMKCYDFLLYQ